MAAKMETKGMLATGSGTAVAEARGVTRDFRARGSVVRALRGVDLCVAPGELVALRVRSEAV